MKSSTNHCNILIIKHSYYHLLLLKSISGLTQRCTTILNHILTHSYGQCGAAISLDCERKLERLKENSYDESIKTPHTKVWGSNPKPSYCEAVVLTMAPPCHPDCCCYFCCCSCYRHYSNSLLHSLCGSVRKH